MRQVSATLVAVAILVVTSRSVAAQSAPASVAQPVVRFSMRTLTGDTVRLGPREPATLIAVFATWCRSCSDEVAAINSLARELGVQGVRVIALNVDKDTDEPVRRWLDAHGAAYPAALDERGGIARALGVVGVPEFHLVSRDGRVVFSRRGPLASSVSLLRAAVANLNPGR